MFMYPSYIIGLDIVFMYPSYITDLDIVFMYPSYRPRQCVHVSYIAILET